MLSENAIDEVLKEGYRTKDMWAEGFKLVSTAEMGVLVKNKSTAAINVPA